MRWTLVLLALLASAAGKGNKHKHKPGRALLDRLSSTTVDVVPLLAGSLQPPPQDVAPYSTVEANATCGQGGAEEYCRDTPAKRIACDICEGPEGSSSRQHPAVHVIDGDPRSWWQSPSMAAGDYQRVELVASLPERMELLHVIIKSGPSPRPLAWSLDVSPSAAEDDWVMVRAFGDKEQCRKLWGLRPERRKRKARETRVARGIRRRRTFEEESTLDSDKARRGMRASRAEKATCSTQFASPRPLENGEMHVGLPEGVTCRRVRISFQAHHPAPDSRRYYTVRALTLAARCLCHGHASHCPITHKGAKCNCLHGTCGSHCQRCCSGARWSPNLPCDEATTDVDIDVAPDIIPDDILTSDVVPDVTNSLSNEELPDCFCGDRGACLHDDTGAIYCVNCTENRAGPLCDRCLPGYYSAVPDGPCLPCHCHQAGSDGTCIFDRKLHQVTCACHPDYTGPLCDSCMDPSAAFPGCMPPTTPRCKCDPRGVLDPSRVCDDECVCKENVVGEHCDACAVGYFGLSASLPAGCQRCYCSNVADHCITATDRNQYDIQTDMILPLSEWVVSTAEGNETLEPSMDDQGNLFLISYEVEGWDSFYWLTQALTGEQLSLYGSEVWAREEWGVVRGDTGDSATHGSDLGLVGADGTKLWYKNRTHEFPGELELSVPLVEGDWVKVSDDGQHPASRTDIMAVLADLRGIMIRGHFHGDQDEVRLKSVWLHPTTLPREVCACPPGYAGGHCEGCAWGHVRSGPGGACVPCACNGHASCRTVDSPCGQCKHNTTGLHCERCLPGHYGNPAQGPCKPCACPLYLPSNNFSPNCALATADGDQFVCTQCPDGYAGDHCEICELGYWGDPSQPGGSCQPCACGGAGCARDTGRCLTCPPHTEGAICDQCQDGYYSKSKSSTEGECVPCACGAGALARACDSRTGACACRHGWAGDTCDTCAPGFGDPSSNCRSCQCGVAALSAQCDVTSAVCACASGAAPPTCDVCLDEYYGLQRSGCLTERRPLPDKGLPQISPQRPVPRVIKF